MSRVDVLLLVTNANQTPWQYNELELIAGFSLQALTHSTCYGWVCLIFPWYCGWSCLLLKEFIHKVTSLLQVWRTRLQVTQNFMTALKCPQHWRSQANSCTTQKCPWQPSEWCQLHEHIVPWHWSIKITNKFKANLHKIPKDLFHIGTSIFLYTFWQWSAHTCIMECWHLTKLTLDEKFLSLWNRRVQKLDGQLASKILTHHQLILKQRPKRHIIK